MSRMTFAISFYHYNLPTFKKHEKTDVFYYAMESIDPLL